MRQAKILFFILLFLNIIFLSYSKAKGEASIFQADSFYLDNGMQVVLVSDHRAPVVSHMVWYKVGSADEPLGQSGIAHFLEHLMFKGTKNYPEGEIMEIVARNGGNQNAFTSYDYTAYYQNIAADKLPLMMTLEADRMRNIHLNKESIDIERKVVLEERRMRTDSNPFRLLSERLNAALWFTNHYGVPVIGWEDEIKKINPENLRQFYNKWYIPKNSILVVAGDIELNQLKEYAMATYAKIPNIQENSIKKRSSYLPPKADIRITMKDKRVRQSRWYKTFIAPSINVGNKSDTYSLSLFNEIFGSGSTSRLYQSLVVKKKLATSASSNYSDTNVSWGSFSIFVTPVKGVGIDEIESQLNQELDKVIKNGFSAEELEIAKRRINANLVYLRDSPIQAARTLGSLMVVGMSLEEIESWPNKVKSIELEEVNSVTADFLNSAPSAIGILLPDGSS